MGSSFWYRPHIATLLRPADKRDSDVDDSIVRELEALAARGPPSDATGLTEAARRVRALHSAVARCDLEISQLARDAGAIDRDAITGRLAAFGPEDGAERAEMRELRALLQRQLERFDQLNERRTEIAERRRQLIAELRGLSPLIDDLRGSPDATGRAVLAITERVKAVSNDIDAFLAAGEDLRGK